MQPLSTQLVVFCTDALAQAQFWSAALGWPVEDNHDLVTQLLDGGVLTEEDTVADAHGRRFFDGFVAIGHPEDPEGRRMLFHRVPEQKTVPNRLHLDLNVGRDAVAQHVERLVGLGATYHRTFDRPEGYWAAMTDPEGNEFDVH